MIDILMRFEYNEIVAMNFLQSLNLFRPTKTRVYPELKEHRRMLLFLFFKEGKWHIELY